MSSYRVAPDAAVDLQMHTTFSDGVWTASELLDHVAGEGFAVIAVTDHDSPHTTAEIQRLAAQHHPGVHVLAAVEMQTYSQHAEHICAVRLSDHTLLAGTSNDVALGLPRIAMRQLG